MSTIKFSKVSNVPNNFGNNELHFYTDNEETLVAALTTEDGSSYHTTPTSTVIQMTVTDTISNKTGTANGAVPLDDVGKIPMAHIPGSLLPLLGKITGPLELTSSETADYSIVEYSSFKNYSISVSHGYFSVNTDIITYTAPDTIGSLDITDTTAPEPLTVTITINGIGYNVSVSWPLPRIAVPTITSPVDGAIGMNSVVTFTTSAFTVMYGQDTHLSTNWELATDASFTTIVHSSYNDTVNKTQWTVSNLTVGTTYYIRAKHIGTSIGGGSYSAYNMITTRMLYDMGSESSVLTLASADKNDNFGYSVAISGDGTRIAMSAPYAGKNYGSKNASHGVTAVYRWTGTSWVSEAILKASNDSKNQNFGVSLSMTGDATRIVVGAPMTEVSKKSKSGALYVYRRDGTTWTEEAILVASDPSKNAELGTSTSISDDGSIIVSGAARSGSGYIFVRNGTSWSQQQKILSDGNFGISCAIAGDGTRCVFGRSNTSNGNTYVYRLSGTTWTLEQSITVTSGLLDSAGYGISVSMNSDGSKIAGGASTKDSVLLLGADAGAAYIHTRTGTNWSLHSQIVASDNAAGDNFGSSIYITRSGYGVIVGAINADPSSISNAGKTYIYSLNDNIWNEAIILTASSAASNDNFGFAVAMTDDGTRGIISSIYKKMSGVDKAGAVYIFG